MPFEANLGASTYSPASIGSVLTVCYDPKNVKHIVLAGDDASASWDASAADASPAPSAGPTKTVELLAQLEKMHVNGSLSDDKFAQAKREVLGES